MKAMSNTRPRPCWFIFELGVFIGVGRIDGT